METCYFVNPFSNTNIIKNKSNRKSWRDGSASKDCANPTT